MSALVDSASRQDNTTIRMVFWRTTKAKDDEVTVIAAAAAADGPSPTAAKVSTTTTANGEPYDEANAKDVGPAAVESANVMNQLRIEQERGNEQKYRELYMQLMRHHYEVLRGQPGDAYRAENEFLRAAKDTEVNSMAFSLIAGTTAFVTLRYFPRAFVYRFGSQERIKALQKAEAEAKASGTRWIRSLTGTCAIKYTFECQ